MKKAFGFLVSILCLAVVLAGCRKGSEATELTPEQINDVNAKFYALLPTSEDEDVSAVTSEMSVTLNPICHFFKSYYEDVTELDMGQFVYYIPRETYLTENDMEEIEELKQSGFELPFEQFETSPVPFGRIPYATVDNYLKTYANKSLKDMTNMGDAIYSDKYQCFYSYASDFDPGFFNCTRGTIDGDIVTLYSDTAILTLKRDGDNYYIVSYIKNDQ